MPKVKPKSLYESNPNAWIDSTLQAPRNKGLDFVKRLYQLNTPTIPTPPEVEGYVPGQTSTHLMAYDPKSRRVYPRVVNQSGKLNYLQPDPSYDYADSTGEFIEFPTAEQANFFTQNYKKGKGVLQGFKNGGTVMPTPRKRIVYRKPESVDDVFSNTVQNYKDNPNLPFRQTSKFIDGSTEVGVSNVFPRIAVENAAGSPLNPFTRNELIRQKGVQEEADPINKLKKLYQAKRTQVDKEVDAVDTMNYDPNKDTLNLKVGRFRGGKLGKPVVDAAIVASKTTGVPLGKILSIGGRESGYTSAYASGGEHLRELVEGHDIHEKFQPKRFEQFLFDKGVPDVYGEPGKLQWDYGFNNEQSVRDYLTKNPGLIDEYKGIVDKTPALGGRNSLQLAAEKIRDEGFKGYNKNPNYATLFNKDYNELATEPELQNYLKMKGAKYKNGGTVGKRRKYAAGGTVDKELGQKQVAGLINQSGTAVLDGIMSLIEGTPQYSDQPIINTSTMRNMSTPYSFAMGGTIEDYDEDELFQLQQQADELGITIEELLEQQNQYQDAELLDMYGGEEEEEEFIPEEEEEEEVVEEDSGDYYALGGMVPIEAEGGEIIESPNGNLKKVVGPSHENGGVDIGATKGDEVFSKRLTIDGKSMADRKLNREKNLAKLEKLGETSSSSPTQNTIKRTSQIIEMEEQKDMALQEMAGKLYGEPGKAAYGKTGKWVEQGRTSALPYNYVNEWSMNPTTGAMGEYYSPNTLGYDVGMTGVNGEIGYKPPHYSLRNSSAGIYGGNTGGPLSEGKQTYNEYSNEINPISAPAAAPSWPGINAASINNEIANNRDMDFAKELQGISTEDIQNQLGQGGMSSEEENNDAALGVGDYVGMAGNLFNAIAPIINTRNAAKATKPNINRYKGFGHDALEANEAAKDYASTMKANAITNLNSSNNAAIARNRGGARSVNTMRALDIATNMGANKATNDINSSFSNQMIGLLGQQGQLENQQDTMEMKGATDVDIRNQQDVDNYYSNMAQNLTNAGTNIQGLGRNLNKSRANQDNLDIMALLTENGIRIGKNKKGDWSIQNSK